MLVLHRSTLGVLVCDVQECLLGEAFGVGAVWVWIVLCFGPDADHSPPFEYL